MKNQSLMMLLANAGFMLVIDSSHSPSLAESTNLRMDIDEISTTLVLNKNLPINSKRIFKEIKEEIKPLSCPDGGCQIIRDPACGIFNASCR